MVICDHPGHLHPVEVEDKLFFGHVRSTHRDVWARIEENRLVSDVATVVAMLRTVAADLDAVLYARAEAVAVMRIAAASLEHMQVGNERRAT